MYAKLIKTYVKVYWRHNSVIGKSDTTFQQWACWTLSRMQYYWGLMITKKGEFQRKKTAYHQTCSENLSTPSRHGVTRRETCESCSKSLALFDWWDEQSTYPAEVYRTCSILTKSLFSSNILQTCEYWYNNGQAGQACLILGKLLPHNHSNLVHNVCVDTGRLIRLTFFSIRYRKNWSFLFNLPFRHQL